MVYSVDLREKVLAYIKRTNNKDEAIKTHLTFIATIIFDIFKMM